MFGSDHGRELPLKINAATREVNKISAEGKPEALRAEPLLYPEAV
jgi:hypothetical protein